MKKLLIFILLSALGESLNAQISLSGDIHGTPISAKKIENLKGSPYLEDQWTKGTVKLKNKTMHSDMQLKYDQMNEKLIFKNEEGDIFHFQEAVEEFTLEIPDGKVLVFRNGFKNIEKNDNDTFYQLLTDGKSKLLKHVKKSIIESIPYGQSVPEKSILTSESFYIIHNDTIQKLKKNGKKTLSFLNSEGLSTYVDKHRLDLNKENDLISAIAFYNSL